VFDWIDSVAGEPSLELESSGINAGVYIVITVNINIIVYGLCHNIFVFGILIYQITLQ
jgi:hypothetical protein